MKKEILNTKIPPKIVSNNVHQKSDARDAFSRRIGTDHVNRNGTKMGNILINVQHISNSTIRRLRPALSLVFKSSRSFYTRQNNPTTTNSAKETFRVWKGPLTGFEGTKYYHLLLHLILIITKQFTGLYKRHEVVGAIKKTSEGWKRSKMMCNRLELSIFCPQRLKVVSSPTFSWVLFWLVISKLSWINRMMTQMLLEKGVWNRQIGARLVPIWGVNVHQPI